MPPEIIIEGAQCISHLLWNNLLTATLRGRSFMYSVPTRKYQEKAYPWCTRLDRTFVVLRIPSSSVPATEMFFSFTSPTTNSYLCQRTSEEWKFELVDT